MIMDKDAERILGFDLREMWDTDDKMARGRTSRATSFLRDGIQKPLSIDSSIWLSLLEEGLVHGQPPFVGGNMPLWSNLARLEDFLATRISVLRKPLWLIAITIFKEDIDRKPDRDSWPRAICTVPREISPNWDFVGFEVCSRYNESALTGTLFQGSSEYIDELVSRWGPTLNKFHLFEKLQPAVAFRDFKDQCSNHGSPHVVYGIWRIKEISS